MKVLSIGGSALILAGITLGVTLIVQKTKGSETRIGLVALALALLVSGIGGLTTFSMIVSSQEEDATEAATQGGEEYDDKIDELNNMSADEMDIGL